MTLPLTILDPTLEDKRCSTSPGMAHWAGTGPSGKTCRECIFWTGCGEQSGYYAKKGNYAGMVKPRPCEKHRDLMQGRVGGAVPHNAAACRYFAENPTPPALTNK